MPPIASPRRNERLGRVVALSRAAAWSHRWAVLAWSLGAGGFLAYFGAAYQVTVKSFAGGAAAFGIAAAPVAEAMRPLSGPSDRLDTYGGYVTYHNATYLALLLSLWGLIQGARAIRGWEERGVIGVWLATGMTRVEIAVARWLGFLAALAVVGIAVGTGYGIGMSLAGEPRWLESYVFAGETILVAGGCFGIGLVVAQLTRSARAGAGIGALVMLTMSVANNMSESLGGMAWVRFLSLFFYFHQSRVLIPGYALNVGATLVLSLAAIGLAVLGIVAFARREVGAGLFRGTTRREAATAQPARLTGFWTRDAWLADVRGSWISISAWALGGGLLMLLLVSVASKTTEIWETSDLIKQLFAATPGASLAERYMSYVTIMAALVPVAFVVAEAARWVSDLHERRAEVLVGAWGSRSRLVLEWAASMVAALTVIDLAVAGGGAIGGVLFGVALSGEGLIRVGAAATLLGLGIGGVALLVVVVFRSEAAVGVLGGFLGAGYVISVFGPLFKWPEWLLRLSPFHAFGAPYVAAPENWGITLLAGLALAGTAAALAVARRRSALA